MESKIVCISGGTSGIGLATAEILLERGWQAAICGRNPKKGTEALQYYRRR